MKQLGKQDGLILLLGVLVLASPLLLLANFTLEKHHFYTAKIADTEPRFARLQGLASAQPQLDEALNTAQRQLDLYAYRASQDASQAGNDAQQRLRNIFSQARLDVVSSQVLPPKSEKTFDRVPLSLRLEGDLIGLQSALSVLPSQNPVLLIDSVNVQTLGAVLPDRPQRLAIQINVSVLRMKP